jgi:glycerol-3-phosphate acyltransferase PlsY
MDTVLALILGYLLGSIPFGLILTRLGGTDDIRSIGSGNIGATNVLRTGRKGLAVATLLGDALKGTAAVLLARHFWGGDAPLVAALGAFLGHLFPVWLGLKGGKGVATFLGVLLGLHWPLFVAFAFIWLAVAVVTRYSSAAALAASAMIPLVAASSGTMLHAVLLLALMAALLWWKHSENIRRLMDGTEGKIGQKS